jgi:phenylalanyl-tRNA synthetase beta chain
MKFSYTLIKKIIPEVKSKKQIVDALNYYAYEVEDLSGNVFDVKVPANRFSDAASHLGIAKELACILNLPFKYKFDFKFKKLKESDFKVEIKNKKLCLRYAALRLDNVNVEESPGWLQKILIECGLNPINNVVDIMNYVMLFLGEPMHAFDFDKLEGSKILIRNAKEGEKVITLDEKEIKLNENILVIADIKKPIAIAGIKGGKETGVDKNTKRILVEAANFEPANIYRTYKSLGLPTDAALRFSHRLSLNLPLLGLKLAEKLLREITKGKVTGFYDSLGGRVVNEQKDVLFDLEKFNKFIGLEIKKDVAYEFLKKLGFKKVGNNIWSTPFLRLDIENSEDVFEEITRLYGYNFILPQTTSVKLLNTTLNEEIIWKEKIRKMLIGFSLNEASNYSFVSEKDLKENNFDLEQVFELINPIS